MRKQALTDDILMRVEKPARYVGGELNAVMKDKEKIAVRFAMCFPDVYEIGMSYLGIQIRYDLFNRREDTWCERVYSPWPDLDAIMREKKIPLFALESQDPLKEFDFLGFTLQYEMGYTNILQVLDLAGIPLLAKDRAEDDPIVIGGGPCSYNPEPLADFFDLFYMGEGEVSYGELLDRYKENKAAGGSRTDFLKKTASVPGIYVPCLYEAVYNEDGTLAATRPTCPEAPAIIRRVIVKDMDRTVYPDKLIVPYVRSFQDRVTLEVMRGCIRGCRFCQAGMVYRPLRERSVDWLKAQAEKMLRASGYDEITLSSLSTSDYTGLAELTDHLIEECGRQHINISLPSLRIDAFSLDVMSKVQDVKKSSVTFAPEAGTQRMRNVINKGLTEDDIFRGAAEAFHGGWNKVKLYFMLGLPTETDEDAKGIPDLCERLSELYFAEIPKEERNGRVQITASSSFFVPKPFTPFQWASMLPREEYLRRAWLVKDTMRAQKNNKSLHYEYHDAEVTLLEGILARGDRKVGRAILRAYELGCMFDAWSERCDYGKWLQAFAETGIEPEFYTLRERSLDEVFPWDHIDIGVTKAFMRREWERAMAGVVTPNCREACSGCGATSYGCGICRLPRGKAPTKAEQPAGVAEEKPSARPAVPEGGAV